MLRAELPPVGFDLVHAALLLEYVDPPSLFRRVVDWLSPRGALSLVTQEPAAGAPAVSPTRYTSLQALAGQMTVLSAEEVVGLAARAGLRLVRTRAMMLPTGKSLVKLDLREGGVVSGHSSVVISSIVRRNPSASKNACASGFCQADSSTTRGAPRARSWARVSVTSARPAPVRRAAGST